MVNGQWSMVNEGSAIGKSSWWYRGLIGLLLLQAGGAVYALFRSLHWPILHDIPPIHYMTARILSGAVPYQEIFDMNMPATYLIHMGVMQVFGAGDGGWRVFDLLMLALAAGVMVRYLYQRVPPVLLGIAALLFMTFHLGNGPVFAGQRDFLMVPFLVLAGYGIIQALTSDAPRNGWLFSAGLLLGMVACIKPPAVLFGAWLLALWIRVRWVEGRAWVKGALFYIGGGMVVPVLIVLWLVQVGALEAFWTAMTGYVFPYYSKIEGQHFSAVLIQNQSLLTPVLFVIGLVYALWPRRQKANLPDVVLVLVVLYGVVHVVMQGKAWPYHTYPFFYGLFLLLVQVWGRWLQKPGLRFAAVLGLLVLALPLMLRAVRATTPSYALADVKPWVPQLMADLEGYALPEGSEVEVLDTTTGGIHALYLLGIPQASRFVYDFHFYHHTDAPVVQALRQEIITVLKDRKPPLIVLMDKGWLPPHTMDRIEAFPALDALLKTQYTVDKEVPEQYRIYRSIR